MGANGIAEAVGLGTTLLLDALIITSMPERKSIALIFAGIALISLTGIIEGTIVGMMQWRVIHRVFAGLPLRSWLIATVAGAMIAWLLGSLPSTLMDMTAQQTGAPAQGPPPWMIYGLAAGMGFELGPLLGIPQWFVLRRYANRSWIWIPAHCFAWAIGMPVIFVAMDVAQQASSTVITMLTLIIDLFVAGASVGAIHGLALVRLARTSH